MPHPPEIELPQRPEGGRALYGEIVLRALREQFPVRPFNHGAQRCRLALRNLEETGRRGLEGRSEPLRLRFAS
jgi:hypothetical protein